MKVRPKNLSFISIFRGSEIKAAYYNAKVSLNWISKIYTLENDMDLTSNYLNICAIEQYY